MVSHVSTIYLSCSKGYGALEGVILPQTIICHIDVSFATPGVQCAPLQERVPPPPRQHHPEPLRSGRSTRRGSGSNSYWKERLSIVNQIKVLVKTS